jgi:hypothetical protein
MKKVIAALVAAAFSLTVAGAAIAAPAQVNQQHSQYVQVDQHKNQTKKKAAKKSTKKKVAKKKPAAKKTQQTG